MIVRSEFEVKAEEFSWQLTYFELLHETMIDAFNEVVSKAKNTDIEWKDYDAIKDHVITSGVLDKTLKKISKKFNEVDV